MQPASSGRAQNTDRMISTIAAIAAYSAFGAEVGVELSGPVYSTFTFTGLEHVGEHLRRDRSRGAREAHVRSWDRGRR